MSDPMPDRLESLFAEAIELDESSQQAMLARLAETEPDTARELAVLLRADSRPTIQPLRASPLQMALGSDQPAWDLEPPPDRIGPYELLEQVGRGGFGVVYKARQTEPIERVVAIKLLLPGLASAPAVRRFQKERRTLALLNHPNIASLLEAGQTPSGRPYVVMEFVDGVPLLEHCRTRGLDTEARLGLFLKACDGVVHAHQRAVIHRDLKQTNILVTTDASNESTAKVIDFGIADMLRAADDDRTRITAAGQFVGTPEYMAPEQLVGGSAPADVRADVYSLGVVLYELLTGQLPYTRDQALAASLKGDTTRFPDPVRPSTRVASTHPVASERRSMVTRLRRDLDWIVLKAISPDPNHRYASVSELAADLRRHLSDQPILAKSPTASDRLRRTYRRNPAAVVASGLSLLLLIAGTIASSIGWFAAVGARQRESQARAKAEIGERNAESSRQIADAQRLEAERGAYAAVLAGVAASLESGASSDARRQLDRAPERLRGWEWLALRAMADTSSRTIAERLGAVQHLAASPDGRTLAACVNQAGQGRLILFDAASGLASREFTLPRCYSSSFSPDGRTVAVASDGLRLIDVASGEMRAADATTGTLLEVDFSPAGDRIGALRADDSAVLLIDPRGQAFERLPASGYLGLAFSPDGRFLAAGGRDGELAVIELASKRVAHRDRVAGDMISAVAFSHDGSMLAVGERLGALRVLRTSDWSDAAAMNHLRSQIIRIAFSPDDRSIAVSGPSGYLAINDVSLLASPRSPCAEPYRGHSQIVHGLAYSPDGRELWSGDYDGSIKAWETSVPRSSRKMMRSAQGRRQSISPDGRRYAVVGDGGVAVVFDATNDAETVRVPMPAHVTVAPFDASGEQLLHLQGDRLMGVAVREPHESRSLATLPLASGGEIRDVSRDGRWVAVWVYARGLLIVDLRDGTTVPAFKEPRGEIPFRFLSDREFALRTRDGAFEVRTVPDGAVTMRLEAEPQADRLSYDAMLSPDRRSIVVARLDSTLSLHDFASGTLIAASERLPMFPGSCSMTPDGTRVVTLGEGGLMRSFEVPSMRQVCAIRLSPAWADGLLSDDGTLFICFALDGSVLTIHTPKAN